MEENQRKISNKKMIKYLKHQKMANEIDRMAEKIKFLGRFEEVIHDDYHGINLHLWFQRNDFEIQINQGTDFKYNIVKNPWLHSVGFGASKIVRIHGNIQ